MTIVQILFAFFLFFFSACTDKKNADTYPSLPDYDFTNPIVIHLQTNLEEISGITYYPKDNSIFAIDDEDGFLYKIFIRKEVQIKKWKFSEEADYEDIVLHDSTFYTLQSNGQVKIFTFISRDSLKSQDCNIPADGNNEYETLYYDPSVNKIIAICKDCASDENTILPAYAFDPVNHTFADTPYFSINTDDIAAEMGTDEIIFRPSCAAVNPLTKDVYIISSENKALVIANHSGKVKDVYELNPALFKQPEGITFSPAGDLMISNEAADAGAPNILIFKYQPSSHDKD